MDQEVSCRWPNFMVELEAQVQEVLGVSRYVRGDGRLRTEGTNLEDCLHLVELSPGMLSCEHLDNQATDAPYISLFRVCDLFDNFWSHPIDGALEGRTVKAIPWHEIVF